MLGRSVFPAMDNIVTITFTLTMNAAAIGGKWQGIIHLNPPLELDNRPGEFVLLSFLHSARFYGPHNVRLQLLHNDLPPIAGVSFNARYDVVQSLQVIIDVPADAATFTNKKLIVIGCLGAPESPVSVATWADVDPSITVAADAPFVVKNKNGVVIESYWYPVP